MVLVLVNSVNSWGSGDNLDVVPMNVQRIWTTI